MWLMVSVRIFSKRSRSLDSKTAAVVSMSSCSSRAKAGRDSSLPSGWKVIHSRCRSMEGFVGASNTSSILGL